MDQKFFKSLELAVEYFADKISTKIEQRLNLPNNSTSLLTDKTEDVIFNINELSSFVGLSKPTIYGHVHRKTIPFIKKGKMLRFSKNDILKWLQDGKSQSASTLEAKVNDYLAKKPLF
ncbi:helix-turn-helix domain-containing protein [Flavobacterium lacus]|uniref:AlpA family transcriptional regulator n=1 Tax=Flavobacterium lacus TaxID=1353778 RepID=A0A328WX50_9FLAO|nr:helix-turn-helix domain-containing protein [Flavobacterium lacus]RAR50861.1 AlpA family transcriptional regulator [Flavobacterium lacus]